MDRKELYPHHADFLSRLAMTFECGDYAAVEDIPDKEKVSEALYRRSLQYAPDARAYLGLGIYHQKNGDYQASIEILSEGVEYWPRYEQLNLCLGVSYMNLAAYKEALALFLKFQHSKQAIKFIVQCYRSLNDFEKASNFAKKLEQIR